ncbi:MAG TPA: hypothetical protein VFK44_12460 [Bacillales bacterium]|nr:hypothetical protein [Bacillales bacterium]
MARDEKLNEEAARDPNLPPTADPKDLVFLNRLADEKKQLPRREEDDSHVDQRQ